MKDPAILFYTSDFLTGTMFMNDEQVGKYIRLICAQHQKGRLSKEDMLKICKTYDKDVFDKFKIDKNGDYYNVRLESESIKRKKYSESRSKNRKGKVKKTSTTYVKHMEDTNEDVNISKDETEIIKPEKPKSLHIQLRDIFCEYYFKIKDVKYSWDAKEATSLTRLVTKLKNSIGEDFTDEKIIQGFTYMIKHIEDTWIMEHFTIAIINSNYNTIIAKIKNHGKSGNSIAGWAATIIKVSTPSEAGPEN